MKIWIIIWRLNPPHIWHMRIIEKSFIENDKTIVFLWSSNIFNEKNPFNYEKRKNFLEILYWDNKNLIIDNLDDFENDIDWIISLKEKIEKYFLDKNINITFYWWDFINDYAINVLKKYIDLLWFTNILFKEINRNDIKIKIDNKLVEISSTNVRDALKIKNIKLLEKLLDKKILDLIL